jgi:aminobenzoyl-glutamate utilization protein B
MQTRQDLFEWLDENQQRFTNMADAIWEKPEVAWEEFFASQLQADFLNDEGFTVWSIADMPTSFVAEWGEGGPIIGFLGEYDALPGLSQKIQPTLEPVEKGAPGHGCGHNLLGTGAVASALVIKNWLEVTGTPGRVRYYGCPAEERLSAKAFMARAGVFDDLDVAFNFHPGSSNNASKGSSVALYSFKFQFHGRTSHAGGSPHLGRSALDAVELMNVGVNYLREHVLSNIRMHYVITKGGEAPNIVPDLAEVWYYLRAHQPDELTDLIERVRKVANGAALMTETRVEEIYDASCSNLLSNHTLADLQYKVIEELGAIDFTEEEIAFAEAIKDQYPKEMFEDSVKYMRDKYKLPEEAVRKPLLASHPRPDDKDEVGGGSTDVGDASWCTPLSMVWTTCFALAAPAHSWGIVATAGMSIGHKGMIYAAKIMAAAAMDCYTDPTHIEKAREEFQKSTKGQPYKSNIPENVEKALIDVESPPGNLTERYPECPFYDRDKR